MQTYYWIVVVASSVSFTFLHAQETIVSTLEETVVTATRYEQDAAKVNAQISLIKSSQVDALQPRSFDDLFRYEPGVEFSGGPRLTGQQLRIRGEGGNAVTVMIDGARQNFISGHSGQRFFVDPELISSGDILRGSGSHLYGSGGAGVVSLRTWGVDDFVDDSKPYGGRLKVGYASGNDEMIYSGVAAIKEGPWDFLVAFVHRDAGDVRLGNGLDSVGSAIRVNNFLVKGGYTIDSDQRLELSYTNYESKDSNGANPQRDLSRSNSLVDRETTRDQLTLAYDWSPQNDDWFDLNALLYWNGTEQSRFYQAKSGKNQDRSNTYKLDTLSFEVVNHSRYSALASEHNLITGFEIYHDKQRGEETRADFFTPGSSGTSRSRPNAETETYGLFVRNDAQWENGIAAAVGLRYDYASSSSDTGRDQSDGQFSPNIELRYEAINGLSVFSNYSHAFTSPTLSAIYSSGSHFGVVPSRSGGYFEEVFVPNDSLSAQTSENIEIGVDYTTELGEGNFTSRLVWFHKNGKDTLDSEIIGTKIIPDYRGFRGPGTLRQNQRQSVNRDKTTIQGWEAVLNYASASWYADASLSIMEGENDDTKEKLNTIPGDKVALEAGYFINEDVTLGARSLWVSNREDKVEGAGLKTSGYDIHGVFAQWKVHQDLALTVGVHNLFDQEYERTNIAQSEPGRSYYINASFSF